jgi:hypothetical protein
MFTNFISDARFAATIAAFDALNAQDTNTIELEGQLIPKELHDAQAMTRWIDCIYPDASETVHLAARCQHLCRWEVPRQSYPAGKVGYHQWRTYLKQFHADKSAEVLAAKGYEPEQIDAVRQINLKLGLKANPQVQQIEDALCLVFLERQFEGYLDQWDEGKVIRILQKTWAKMSETGHAAALQLPYSERALALVQKALAG